MRRVVIPVVLVLCLLLTSCGKALPSEELPSEAIESIRAEIAEELGLPTEAVFVVEVKECHSENADFYLVEVLIEDEDYRKATYVVQIDEDEDGLLIMDWQVKEGGK